MSLLKLSEIRANKPGINLLHYIALEAEKIGCENIFKEMSNLDDATK